MPQIQYLNCHCRVFRKVGKLDSLVFYVESMLPWSWSMEKRDGEIMYFTKNWDILLLWQFKWEISPTVLVTWKLGSQLMVLFQCGIVGGVISLGVGFERLNTCPASSSHSLLYAWSLKLCAYGFMSHPPSLSSVLRDSYYCGPVNPDKPFFL